MSGPNSWPPAQPVIGTQTWAGVPVPRQPRPVEAGPPVVVLTARHLLALWLAVAAVAVAVLVLAVAQWQRPVHQAPASTVTSTVSAGVR